MHEIADARMMLLLRRQRVRPAPTVKRSQEGWHAWSPCSMSRRPVPIPLTVVGRQARRRGCDGGRPRS